MKKGTLSQNPAYYLTQTIIFTFCVLAAHHVFSTLTCTTFIKHVTNSKNKVNNNKKIDKYNKQPHSSRIR